MKKKNILMFVSAIIIVGVSSFYLGSYYYSNKQVLKNANFLENSMPLQRAGNFAGGLRNGGNNFTGGTVISKDDKSMTIQAKDGSSKVVFFTQSTPIIKTTSGSSSDILIGKDVTITGIVNPDGSISAESVQIRSMIMSTQK